MGGENSRTGVWQGILDGFGDELQQVAGLILGRTTAIHSNGDTTLNIEGTHRFTENGVIAVADHQYYYTGKTETQLLQLSTELEGNPTGLVSRVREQSIVALLSGDVTRGSNSNPITDFDKLRMSFFVETAVGDDLDRIARSHGVNRPRGLDDERFRRFLMVFIALDASTIYAMQKVLDIFPGENQYEITEDEWKHPNEVFVKVTSSLQGDYRGKAFMNEQIFVPATAIHWTPNDLDGNRFTLPGDSNVRLVYGVWGHNDLDRNGENYLEASFPCRTHADKPRMVDSVVGDIYEFTNLDLGRGCRFTVPNEVRNDYWNIQSVHGPVWSTLGKPTHEGGIVTVGIPKRLMSPVPVFESWMEGHGLQITASTMPTNIQRATIEKVQNGNTVFLTDYADGEPFIDFKSDQGGVSFTVFPKFGDQFGQGGQNMLIHLDRSRRSGDGLTVYCPSPDVGGRQLDPQGVWVDVVTIPSAQSVLSPQMSGEHQYPFYLFDEFELVRSLLDVITAAGVRPTLIEEDQNG